MRELKRLAIFCGANSGHDALYAKAAKDLATELAARKIGLVYGGGKVGLMGAVADQMIELEQEVIGVIPQFLVAKELAHYGSSRLDIVESMHERKARMATLADGFILLPGGFGSLDEFFEILTWGQLGLHNKPCGILNINNYYDFMVEFLNHAVTAGFIAPIYLQNIIIEDDSQTLLDRFAHYQAPTLQQPKHIENIEQT